MKSAITTSERRRACLFGGAIGDAFGYEVESNNLATIRHRFGPGGLLEPVLHEGKLIVSDDTQMTLFTLEAILDCEPSSDQDAVIGRIRHAYLDWYQTQQDDAPQLIYTGQIGLSPVLHVQRSPGHTCLTAMREGGTGTMDTPINDSKGCGGVMRVAPIGLFPQRWSVEEVFKLGMRASAITHTHPSGYLSTGLTGAIIRLLMDGLNLHEAVLQALPLLFDYEGHEETLFKVEQALRLAESELETIEAIETLGQGWVGEETLAIAIYAAFRGRDFQHVIGIAANHTGDSDSTASVAGQLFGAWHGMTDIPQTWIKSLDIHDILNGLLEN